MRPSRPRYRRSEQRLHRLAMMMYKANIGALADLWLRPGRMLWLNFLAGLARGFGIAIGLTLIAAAFLSLLGRLAALNLPVIGRFIAEIVRLVETYLHSLPA